ncbi:hypothetical protein ABWK22_02070 [Gottfriedia acidiceleris]|uniref:hypothetical protein n=1 Tax=Gottfriedia acidiceleris TaxID=371036 RepID=UPI0033940F8E
MNYSFDIKEEEIQPGRICLGVVKVEMGRMFIFGSQQKLHEMVSVIPGMGNGAYEIYATIKNVPGYGFRTTKIEIECITDEEISYYERLHSDHVLEVAY